MSWFSKVNPTPGFPAYTGPYEVGSVDVELPAADLDSPSPEPDNAVPTVAFRIFYPCERPTSRQRLVRWVPRPQRGFVGAYAKMLGANFAFSGVFALLPQQLYWINIPVHRNAKILDANTKSGRWPVVVFSHGLGGHRNAYSHLLGSLASYGVVVIAADHRDGSAPISYMRATETTEARTVPYRSVPHKPSQETYDARDEMLKLRLWELGLVHDAVLKIDSAVGLRNLDPNSFSYRKQDRNEILDMFKDKMDVHNPGSITWAGHSFGSATTYQFVKSTYWRASGEKEGYLPLFSPRASCSLVRQITPKSTVVLLDMWCLPLKSPNTQWLFEKPLPCYTSMGSGGTNLLAVLSETFFKWKLHLNEMRLALSERPAEPDKACVKTPPRFFYPTGAAHLSQSDFAILFPRFTRRVFKAEDPERMLELNTRAILQLMRENGKEVCDFKLADTDTARSPSTSSAATSTTSLALPLAIPTLPQAAGDWQIFSTAPTDKPSMKGWTPISLAAEEIPVESEQDLAKKNSDEDIAVGETIVEGEVLGEVVREVNKLSTDSVRHIPGEYGEPLYS